MFPPLFTVTGMEPELPGDKKGMIKLAAESVMLPPEAVVIPETPPNGARSATVNESARLVKLKDEFTEFNRAEKLLTWWLPANDTVPLEIRLKLGIKIRLMLGVGTGEGGIWDVAVVMLP